MTSPERVAVIGCGLIGTSIAMADGKKASSLIVGNTGAVSFTAAQAITVSLIEAGGTISLTATNGAITDGLTGTNPNLDGETATVTLTAGAGIGTGASPIQTRVDRLAASVTTSGGLFIREATSLRIFSGTNTFAVDLSAPSANMNISTVNGSITVEKGIRSTGTTSGGNLRLETAETAEGTASDANIDIRAEISSAKGSISLTSADDVVTTSAGKVQTTATAQTVDILAAGAITMNASSQVLTTDGNQRLEAQGGSVTLGRLSASGTGNVTVKASVGIFDGDADALVPQTINVTANNVRLDAGTAIGTGSNAIETSVSLMAAKSSSGGIYLNESNAVTVGSVAAITVNRIDNLGAASSTVSDSGALAGITPSSGAALVLTTGGKLTVNSALTAAGAGHVRIDVTGDLDLNALLDAGSGNVTVLASGILTQAAAGDIVTTGTGTVDVQGGTIVMNDGATVGTGSGNIRYVATGTMSLGALSTTGDVSLSASSITDSGTTDTRSESTRLNSSHT